MKTGSKDSTSLTAWRFRSGQILVRSRVFPLRPPLGVGYSRSRREFAGTRARLVLTLGLAHPGYADDQVFHGGRRGTFLQQNPRLAIPTTRSWVLEFRGGAEGRSVTAASPAARAILVCNPLKADQDF